MTHSTGYNAGPEMYARLRTEKNLIWFIRFLWKSFQLFTNYRATSIKSSTDRFWISPLPFLLVAQRKKKSFPPCLRPYTTPNRYMKRCVRYRINEYTFIHYVAIRRSSYQRKGIEHRNLRPDSVRSANYASN